MTLLQSYAHSSYKKWRLYYQHCYGIYAIATEYMANKNQMFSVKKQKKKFPEVLAIFCFPIPWGIEFSHKRSGSQSTFWDGEALFLFFTFDTDTFQIGHFCFNLILTEIVQPDSVLTWHSFAWTQFCSHSFDLTVLLHLLYSHIL